MRYIDHFRRITAYKHIKLDGWTYEMVAERYSVTVSAVQAMLRSREQNARIGLGPEAVDKICAERDEGLKVSDISLYWNVPEEVILTLDPEAEFVPGRKPKPAGYAFPRDKYDAFIAEYDSIPPKTQTRRSIAEKYGLTEGQLSWIVSGNARTSRVVSPEMKEQIMEDIKLLNSNIIGRLAEKYGVPYDIARSWIGNHQKDLRAQQEGLGR